MKKYRIKKPTPALHPVGTIIEQLSERSDLYKTEPVENLWSYYYHKNDIEKRPDDFELIEE